MGTDDVFERKYYDINGTELEGDSAECRLRYRIYQLDGWSFIRDQNTYATIYIKSLTLEEIRKIAESRGMHSRVRERLLELEEPVPNITFCI